MIELQTYKTTSFFNVNFLYNYKVSSGMGFRLCFWIRVFTVLLTLLRGVRGVNML